MALQLPAYGEPQMQMIACKENFLLVYDDCNALTMITSKGYLEMYTVLDSGALNAQLYQTRN